MQAPPVPLQFDASPARIVIAAGPSSFRQSLRRQLEAEPLIEVVGDASDTRSAAALIRRVKPDILVIESALHREFSALSPSGRDNSISPGIVVIIETSLIQNIIDAFELGARGVVLRASLPRLWRTGIQSIIAGQYWVEDNTIALLLEAVRNFLVQPAPKALPDFGLTLREVEIAAKIAAGRSNKDVGREFAICERTVKHHLTNIFRKVGVSSRLELAVLVRDQISPDSAAAPSPILQTGPDQKVRSVKNPHLHLVSEP